jgi:carbon storage regulator
MLVIARKVGQTIVIGDGIEVTVAAVRGDQVRLAIKAQRSIPIQRRETLEAVQRDNVAAASDTDDILQLLGGVSDTASPDQIHPVTPKP